MPPQGREVSEQSEDLVRSLVALGVPQAKVSDVIHAACRHIEILEDVDHRCQYFTGFGRLAFKHVLFTNTFGHKSLPFELFL